MQTVLNIDSQSRFGRAVSLAARFRDDVRGATSIEYGLLAMLLAVACIGAFTQFGSSSNKGWGSMANKVNGNLN